MYKYRNGPIKKFNEAVEKVKGRTDWVFVDKIFKALSDTKVIQVIARRNSNVLPLKGKAYFKDVRIYKYIPEK